MPGTVPLLEYGFGYQASPDNIAKMEEFQTHVRGALKNGLSPNEIRAVLTQIAIYCGIPVGVDCFRIAKAVLGEAKKA